ncbi:hypothetical protein HDU76_013570, partial [Blyttiomyces sp. JEL0837]
MTDQLILADENDKKWHCNKEHNANNPEKNCDHPWHIVNQTLLENQNQDPTKHHESALKFLQLFHDADPRIQGLHHYCFWLYCILMAFSTVAEYNVDINKQYLETLRAIEKDKSQHLLSRTLAALFQAFFHAPQDYNNSHIAARKYLKVLELCDEAYRQGGFFEISRYN